MSIIELTPGIGEPDDVSSGITAWEDLRVEHQQYPDAYQSVLEMVPPWGQDLLVRLRNHHPDSFAHSLRVAATIDSALEGRPFGSISPESVTLAALLHDVGKQAVPLRLLEKDGPLTVEERDKVKPHALQSYIAIEPHDLLVAQLAGGHHLYQRDAYGHESARNVPWDAAAGQQLIAIADVVDALGSARSYKPAWPSELVSSTLRSEGNHSPFLIEKMIEARFGIPPVISSQQKGAFSGEQTVFQPRA